MFGPASRLNATLQDRAARLTLCIALTALAGLSAVTNRKHRVYRR